MTCVADSLPERIFIFSNENSSILQDNHFFTSIPEVTNTIKSLKAKKSSGPDNISNFVLKKISPEAIKYLTIIYNNCLNNGYFPTAWKTKIIPLLKKPNIYTLHNFRPISMLSNVGKDFENTYE